MTLIFLVAFGATVVLGVFTGFVGVEVARSLFEQARAVELGGLRAVLADLGRAFRRTAADLARFFVR
jgi:hypothetical protein